MVVTLCASVCAAAASSAAVAPRAAVPLNGLLSTAPSELTCASMPLGRSKSAGGGCIGSEWDSVAESRVELTW